MDNFNKDILLKEFIYTTTLLDEKKYRDLFLYKDITKNPKKEIEYFIETSLYNCNEKLNNNYRSIKDLIIDIEKFDLHEVADNQIDIYYDKLMTSFYIFQNWLDINEKNDLSIIETIKLAQYEAYYELYEIIKTSFIIFLRKKIKRAGKNI